MIRMSFIWLELRHKGNDYDVMVTKVWKNKTDFHYSATLRPNGRTMAVTLKDGKWVEFAPGESSTLAQNIGEVLDGIIRDEEIKKNDEYVKEQRKRKEQPDITFIFRFCEANRVEIAKPRSYIFRLYRGDQIIDIVPNSKKFQNPNTGFSKKYIHLRHLLEYVFLQKSDQDEQVEKFALEGSITPEYRLIMKLPLT